MIIKRNFCVTEICSVLDFLPTNERQPERTWPQLNFHWLTSENMSACSDESEEFGGRSDSTTTIEMFIQCPCLIHTADGTRRCNQKFRSTDGISPSSNSRGSNFMRHYTSTIHKNGETPQQAKEWFPHACTTPGCRHRFRKDRALKTCQILYTLLPVSYYIIVHYYYIIVLHYFSID